MTCAVCVRDGVIVDAAPILRRFIGQTPKQLGAWMRGHGEFRCARIRTPRTPVGCIRNI